VIPITTAVIASPVADGALRHDDDVPSHVDSTTGHPL
jgi:hypothetical protein